MENLDSKSENELKSMKSCLQKKLSDIDAILLGMQNEERLQNIKNTLLAKPYSLKTKKWIKKLYYFTFSHQKTCNAYYSDYDCKITIDGKNFHMYYHREIYYYNGRGQYFNGDKLEDSFVVLDKDKFMYSEFYDTGIDELTSSYFDKMDREEIVDVIDFLFNFCSNC
jgi:hypothetical protein